MELTRQTFDELSRIIHRLTGVVVGKDKSYLVRHRLEGVAKNFGCPTYEALARDLNAAGAGRLHEALIEAITTKETSFFRDPWFFEILQKVVLPGLASTLECPGNARRRIRIWSAAAATGQEACSLAILLREMQDTPGSPPEKKVSILGSDISAVALDRARKGIYAAHEIRRGISETRLRRHFRRVGDDWHIDESLKHLLQFRRLDLLHLPFDLAQFDLVLCRNVLIYFDDESRRRVCRRLYNLVAPGGWLALGSAESLYGLEDRFETVTHGRAVLYRKPRS